MGWLKKVLKKGAKYTPGEQLRKAAGISSDNKLYQILNPGGTAIAKIADGAPITAGNILDPGGWVHGKPMTDTARKEQAAKAAADAAAAEAGAASLKNPWAQFAFQPGIGYGNNAQGVSPFAGLASQIPPEFFQNPQSIAALQQMLGGGGGVSPAAAPMAPAQPPQAINNPFANLFQGAIGQATGTPGPAPSQATQMGRVGGFGNGGGKMTIPGGTGYAPMTRRPIKAR